MKTKEKKIGLKDVLAYINNLSNEITLQEIKTVILARLVILEHESDDAF